MHLAFLALTLTGCTDVPAATRLPPPKTERIAPGAPKAPRTGRGEVPAAPPVKVGPPPAASRAVVIYQEGTREEQIYPMAGDSLTLGRGRDNQIQIKNDARVAREHARIERSGGGFLFVDLKTEDGTRINGERVTERKLVGGEEIIIGSTFFRFRILQ